jgi:hypothetical protein
MMRGNLNLGLDFCTTMASMSPGWSDPRLTKQWETPAAATASKKANDVVYILGFDAHHRIFRGLVWRLGLRDRREVKGKR